MNYHRLKLSIIKYAGNSPRTGDGSPEMDAPRTDGRARVEVTMMFAP